MDRRNLWRSEPRHADRDRHATDCDLGASNRDSPADTTAHQSRGAASQLADADQAGVYINAGAEPNSNQHANAGRNVDPVTHRTLCASYPYAGPGAIGGVEF